MKLIGIKKFTAPNLWSDTDNIMALIVDTKRLRNTVIYKDDDFSDHLKIMFPNLFDKKQTFLQKIQNGIQIEDVIGPVTKELLAQIGYSSQHLRTTHICDGIYQVPFTYTDERAAVQSGTEAVKIVDALAQHKKEKALNVLSSPGHKNIVIAASKQGITNRVHAPI